jgi:hypothetical protein
VSDCIKISKSLRFILLGVFLVLILIVSGCQHNWSEKQKQEFAQKCSETDTIEELNFYLKDFSYHEVENIYIQQIHNGIIVDSFYAHANTSSFDKIRNTYSAGVSRKICIKDIYKIIVPGEKPFILSDMKTVVWPTPDWFHENYECIMANYVIDGKLHEHEPSVYLLSKQRGIYFSISSNSCP